MDSADHDLAVALKSLMFSSNTFTSYAKPQHSDNLSGKETKYGRNLLPLRSYAK
jgi:hypothetical protein